MNIKIKRYYKSKEDFHQFYENLKQTLCPFCKVIGSLILHGYLRGYGENSFNRNDVRGRRVFCNNRKKHKKGCGRTFCVLAVNIIKNFSISANSLWCFLKNVGKHLSKIEAYKTGKFPLSISSTYRIWKRFLNSQSQIRTHLIKICREPEVPETSCPGIQTIEHLKSAFSQSSCPITAFQDYYQASFI